jgi:TPR repeat protein
VAYARKLTAIFIVFCLVLFFVGCARETDPRTAFERGDFDTARQLWLPRAERGDLEAQNYLGVMSYMGFGVPRDYREAARWFETAAKAGHPDAQKNYGMLYKEGLGVPQDYLQAYLWFQAARLQGNNMAEAYLDTLTNKLSFNQQKMALQLAESYVLKPATVQPPLAEAALDAVPSH